MGDTVWLAACLLLSVLLGAACSSASDDAWASGQLSVPEPAVGGEETAAGPRLQATPIALGTEEADVVLTIYEEVIDVSSRLLTGDATAEEIAAVATGRALRQYRSLAEANAELMADEDLRSVDFVYVWIDPAGIDRMSDGSFVVHDCVQMNEENRWGIEYVRFVDQSTTMVEDGGRWRATSVTVRHDGDVGPELTCLPTAFHEETTDEVLAYATAAQGLRADPLVAFDDSLLADFVGADFEDLWRRSAEEMAASGVSLTHEEQHRAEPIGLETSLLEPTAVVALCTRYPDGVADDSAEDGFALEPGSVVLRELLIPIAGSNRGRVIGLETQRVDDSCWEEK